MNKDNLIDNLNHLISNYVPDFEKIPEKERFEVMMNFNEDSKKNGLNSANVLINEATPLLNDISNGFGIESTTYKDSSNKFVDAVTTLILMQVNGNIGLSMASDLNDYNKIRINNDNEFAVILLNKINKFYCNSQVQADIFKIKNKIGVTEKGINPKSSCYIATIVYQDYNSPEVMILREFRDSILRKSFLGRRFIQVYYASNNILSPFIHKHETIQQFLRKVLNKFVLKLKNK
jgi:hypothetical protein